ncbi:MAG: sel1 repeat family protein, partial [Paludibacteraceae bacterium]|nr:sel1 repeat family protein [Paludibacteraceae bacterium]
INKDIITAIYWYKQAAKEDNNARRNLGYWYFSGMEGVSKDLVESLYWYKQAADNGDYVAQKKVADFYRYGWGIDKNDSIALEKYISIYTPLSKLLNSTLTQDDELLLIYNQVCLAIGRMHARGEGCEKNYETAFQWYLACRDYGEAYLYLYWCYSGIVVKDAQKALQQLINNRTAKWKDVYGLKMLADHYAKGEMGLSKSLNIAHEIIDEAITIEPNNPNYYDSKGEFYSMQNNFEKAKEMWLKVKALDATFYTKNNTELNKYIQKQVK